VHDEHARFFLAIGDREGEDSGTAAMETCSAFGVEDAQATELELAGLECPDNAACWGVRDFSVN
jgi:hypothetical protein